MPSYAFVIYACLPVVAPDMNIENDQAACLEGSRATRVHYTRTVLCSVTLFLNQKGHRMFFSL